MNKSKLVTRLITLFSVSCIVCVNSQRRVIEPGIADTIRIGGLFEREDSETAFKFAVERVNGDGNLGPKLRLSTHIERLPKENSFQIPPKVCRIMREGVAAIIGPETEEPASHVQAMADAFDIPHIETKWDFVLRKDNYLINLAPHPSVLGKAFNDLVEAFAWSTYIIIYDSEESLFRLQILIKASIPPKRFALLRKIPLGDKYRDFLRQIMMDNSDITQFIIDCKQDKLVDLLKQAQQVGMLNFRYSFIVTSLDLHTLDLEDFKYTDMNFTALRMIDPDKPDVQRVMRKWTQQMSSPLFPEPRRSFMNQTSKNNIKMISTEIALIYDAVQLLVKALQHLDGKNNKMETKSINCESTDTWQHGYSIINQMKMIQLHGLTGMIQFNTSGFRTDLNLDVIQLNKKGLQKIGTWDSKYVTKFNWSKIEHVDIFSKNDFVSLANKTLIVTTIVNSPFCMLTRSEAPLKGNARYEGYSIEVLQKLSEKLGFKYIIKIVDDNNYGSFNNKTKQWNGMIREILDGVADIAVADVTINKDRQQAVAFTMPFMNLGISILFTVPKVKPPSLFSFMSPFSLDVWIYMAFSFFGVSFILFILGRITPYEWDSPHPCIEDPDQLQNQFTLHNAIWSTIGSIMQQGSDIAPKAVSTRMIAAIWWFFTLIMVSSYTANLATFLIVEDLDESIKSLEDLTRQTKVQYGCLGSGSTASFFRDSPFESKREIWGKMMKMKPSPLMATNKEGVERVKNSNGLYAFFMESTVIEYNIERICGLAQVGGLLDSKGYGIALRKDSKYRQAFSSGILSLQEAGVLDDLKRKWWKEERRGDQCSGSADGEVKPLELANVGGVFVVLVGGCVSATLLAFIEFFYKYLTELPNEEESKWETMRKELSFAFTLRGDTKPVLRRGATRGGSRTKSLDTFSNNIQYS